MKNSDLSRRAALVRLALLAGGTLLAGGHIRRARAAATGAAGMDLTDEELARLDEIGETIIPATDTPGAKSVRIGDFMAMMVQDCYDFRQQKVFRNGLAEIDALARARFGHSFRELDQGQRADLLNQLDGEQRAYTARKTSSEPEHYFRIMKQLTILGYFTSEPGCTQALRHVEVPGAFRGDEPYRKGDRAWFKPPNRTL